MNCTWLESRKSELQRQQRGEGGEWAPAARSSDKRGWAKVNGLGGLIFLKKGGLIFFVFQ